MKIEIFHPNTRSLEFVQRVTDEGGSIRRSPHVGNVPADELRLIFGLSAMGATVNLEMVDTIHGNDNYSKPRNIALASGSITIASLKNSHYKVVGACTASADGAAAAAGSGVRNVVSGKSLAEIHLEALGRVLPPNIRMERSSSYFSYIGTVILKSSIQEALKVVDRPPRYVDEKGKIRITEDADLNNLFGEGENPLEGTLPPLEAMMAIELIDAAMKAKDCDAQTVHIAGNDMAAYTRNPETMGKVKKIASGVADYLGLDKNTTVEYCLPTRSDILADKDFPKILPQTGIVSQHDLI